MSYPSIIAALEAQLSIPRQIYGLDSFQSGGRTGWSPASDGANWTQAAGAGTLSIVANAGRNRGQITNSTVANVLYESARLMTDIDLYVRFNVSSTAVRVSLLGRSTSATTYYRCDVTGTTFQLFLNNNGAGSQIGGAGGTKTVTFAANTYYWMHLRIQGFGATGSNPNNLMANFWADPATGAGDVPTGEPAGWMLTASDGILTQAGQFGVHYKATTTAQTAWYDAFTANDCPPPAITPAYNTVGNRPYGMTLYVPGNNPTPLANQTIIDLIGTCSLGSNPASATGLGKGCWLRWQGKWNMLETYSGLYDWAIVDDAIQKANYWGFNILWPVQKVPSFRNTRDACGSAMTLTAARNSGTAYSTLAVTALPDGAYLPHKTVITVNWGNTGQEVLYVWNPGATYVVGATSIGISTSNSSQVNWTPATTHAIGQAVWQGDGTAPNGGPQLGSAADYATFCGLVAARYNGTAGFGKVDMLQIENEDYDASTRAGAQGAYNTGSSSPSSWDKSSTWDNGGAILAPVYKAARDAILAAYPGCKVFACSVRKTPNTGRQHVQNWVTGFVTQVVAAGGTVDGQDFHYYRDGTTSVNTDGSISLIMDPTQSTYTDSSHATINAPSVSMEITDIKAVYTAAGLTPLILCGETGWPVYDDRGGVISTTTATRNIGAGPFTTLPVAAIPAAIPDMTLITIDDNNTGITELVYAYGTAAKNATTIQITTNPLGSGATQTGWNPSHNHISGAEIYGATSQNPVSPSVQSTYLKSMFDAGRLNGADYIFVYTIDPTPVVHTDKNPAWSESKDSITQKIAGVYTYEPAYSMMAIDSSTYPTWGVLPPPVTYTGLSVSNGHIVDSSGVRVLLRGLNTAGLEFGSGNTAYPLTQERINAFATLFNMNLWRVAINVSWWNNNTFLPDGVTHYQNWIQQVIGWMKAAGCYVEIDPTTWVTMGMTGGPYCNTLGNPPLNAEASDTFTRANGSGWGTASNGDTWAKLAAGTLSISSNEGVYVDATGNDGYMKLGSSSASDQVGFMRIALTQVTGVSGGMLLRLTNASNWYRCYIDHLNTLVVDKLVIGTYTSLSSVSKTHTSGTFYWMRFEVIGTTLYAKTWADGSPEGWTWDIQVTDSSLASGGVGLYGNANASDTVQFDSFTVGTPATSCITSQDTLNNPPWTQAQMITATETFFTSFIGIYGNDPAILYDALNEPVANLNFFSDVTAADTSIINAIQALQPNALIFVSDNDGMINVAFNHLTDIYPQSNLVWDFHLYDDPTWTWQNKLTYFQPVFDYAYAHNHAVSIGEWNAGTTNDPNGMGAAWANLAISQGVANTYYNADNLLLSDNVTLTDQGVIVQRTFQTIAGITPSYMTIGGAPVNVLANSLLVKNTIGRRGELTAIVYDSLGTTHFQQYQQCVVYEQGSKKAWSGYLTSPTETKPGFQSMLVTQLTATDQHYLADKRIVVQTYHNHTCGYIVNDLLTTILAAEGVTAGQIAAGPIVPVANFGYCTVADALDAIVTAASASGVPYYWSIDQNKLLWFVPYTGVLGGTVDGTQIDDGRLSGVIPSVTRANPKYRNKQYAVGGVSQTGINDETLQGDGQTRAFTFRYPLAAAPTTFTLNGTTKTLGTKGQTGFQYYWAQGDNVISQDSSQTILISTDRLRAVYVGQVPTTFTASNAAQIAAQAALDGTSGIVEAVLTDNTIATAADGQSKVNQPLTQYGMSGLLFTFATQKPTYAAGQLITVNYSPFSFVNAQMLISEVDISDQQDSVALWYTISAVQGPYDINWTDFFGNLFKQGTIANSINLGVSLPGNLFPSTTLYPSNTLYPV